MNVVIEQLGIIASRFIPSGTPLPILRGPLHGAKWITGAAAGPAKGLGITMDLVEPAQLKMASRLTSLDGICLDIGANVGFYTLLFARYAKHVFAFEPLPRNVSYLWRTIQINKLGNVTVVPWAVSDSTTLLKFQEGEDVGTGRLYRTGKQPVVTVTCDDFVNNYGVVPSLLKIDVEGAEMHVLRGARDLLAKHKPAILLSIHSNELRVGCLELLAAANYERFVPLDSHETEKASQFAIIS
jgi:FkbM family methyltransferase